LTSRRALQEHFTVPPEVRESLPKRQVVDVVVHETADPEVIVAEFAYEFTLPDDSMTKVPCVFVLRVRDGQIIESRDYIDPIRTYTARGVSTASSRRCGRMFPEVLARTVRWSVDAARIGDSLPDHQQQGQRVLRDP
jgi:hypothetical protein